MANYLSSFRFEISEVRLGDARYGSVVVLFFFVFLFFDGEKLHELTCAYAFKQLNYVRFSKAIFQPRNFLVFEKSETMVFDVPGSKSIKYLLTF